MSDELGVLMVTRTVMTFVLCPYEVNIRSVYYTDRVIADEDSSFEAEVVMSAAGFTSHCAGSYPHIAYR
jgi:hypothetical protein